MAGKRRLSPAVEAEQVAQTLRDLLDEAESMNDEGEAPDVFTIRELSAAWKCEEQKGRIIARKLIALGKLEPTRTYRRNMAGGRQSVYAYRVKLEG